MKVIVIVIRHLEGGAKLSVKKLAPGHTVLFASHVALVWLSFPVHDVHLLLILFISLEYVSTAVPLDCFCGPER